MKNGYNILWTPNALNELDETIKYLQDNFSNKEIKKLVEKIESITDIISKNPAIFPQSDEKNIHRAVILKFNTMYYRVRNKNVEVLSFFSNRQSPDKREF